MRVGVVADTHLPRFGRTLPQPLVEGLRHPPVDRILHLGDFVTPLAVALLEAIAPVDGVAGNNDPPELIERFGRRKVLTFEGVRLGLVHGDGPKLTTRQRAFAAFADEPVDAVLFGHSHIPLCERVDGVWLLNPGSPTDKRRQARYSYGILEIADGSVTASLAFFDRH